MNWSRIVAGVAVAGYLYLPGIRCINGVVGRHEHFSWGTAHLLAELIPLLVIIAVIGWHQTWRGCFVHGGSLAASTVVLYWLSEMLGLATSNQPIDSGSWYHPDGIHRRLRITVAVLAGCQSRPCKTH